MAQATDGPDRARRPAVSVALLLIGGILLHDTLPHVPRLWWAVAVGGFAAGLLLRRVVWVGRLLVAAGVVAGGAAVAQGERFAFADDDIALASAEVPVLARVRLRVTGPPRLVPPDEAAGLPLPPKQALIAEAVAVRTANGWRGASGEILVQIAPPGGRPAAGAGPRGSWACSSGRGRR